MLCGVSRSNSVATGFQTCLKVRSPGLDGGKLSSTCCERAVGGGQALISLRRGVDSIQGLLLLLQKVTDLRSKLLTSGKSVLNAIVKIGQTHQGIKRRCGLQSVGLLGRF